MDDFINVYIDDDTVGEIDKAAKTKNMSRSRLIREAVYGLFFAPEYDPCIEALKKRKCSKTHTNVFIRVSHRRADELRKFSKEHGASTSAVVRYAIDLYLNGGNEE